MANISTALQEQIWGMTFAGFRGGLALARELEEQGDVLSAQVQRASVYYSYFMRRKAFRCIGWINPWGMHLERLTHGQCDVIATIHNKVRKNAVRAEEFYVAGLKKNPPPHGRALLLIGLAEVSLAKEDVGECRDLMSSALETRFAFEKHEADMVQAMRQFARVTLRSALLHRALGHDNTAKIWFKKTWEIVLDPKYRSTMQVVKTCIARYFG